MASREVILRTMAAFQRPATTTEIATASKTMRHDAYGILTDLLKNQIVQKKASKNANQTGAIWRIKPGVDLEAILADRPKRGRGARRD